MIKHSRKTIDTVEVIDVLSSARDEYRALGQTYTDAADLAIMDQVLALAARVTQLEARARARKVRR